jgi:hypothetical protein
MKQLIFHTKFNSNFMIKIDNIVFNSDVAYSSKCSLIYAPACIFQCDW